jgi:hypothetical protein
MLKLPILLFLITLLHFGVDCHSGCISDLVEKEIFELPVETFERDTTPTFIFPIFNVTYDESVPPDVAQGIENVLAVLEGVMDSNSQLFFKVNISSGNHQWGSTSSTFWNAQYTDFLGELPANITQIFPVLTSLMTNIDWPMGWGWTGGRILLTNWQAYARGALSKDNSEFTLWIDEDFMDRFDFNSTDGTDDDKFDFETLILHQMLHELGFHSVVDFLDLNGTDPMDQDFWIFPFDVFRFSYNSPSDEKNFLTDTRQFDPSIPPHTFWDGSLTSPVPLERGVNFTGYNASHWLHQDNDLLFGVMDGNIPEGIAVGLSANDLASFRTMGWTIKDQIIAQATAAILNGSFVAVHGNLLVGPTMKCRFNQDTVVDPADMASNNAYKWINCPIPATFNGQNQTLWVEVSNDGGNTWSNQVRAVDQSSGGVNNGSSSPASHLTGRAAFILTICLGLIFGFVMF